MGNSDKWATPKQIKIERAGEPRGLRRGPIKKGKRKKGKKARIDEILAEKKRCLQYREWMIEDAKRKREHPERYRLRPGSSAKLYASVYGQWFDKSREKLVLLINEALRDGIIDVWEGNIYLVGPR